MEPQYRPNEREKLRKIIDELSRLDYKELLSYWIVQETRKAEMYNSLSQLSEEVIWDERVSRLLKWLYEESINQAQLLLKAFKEQFHQEKPPQIEMPSLEIELSEERLRNMVYRGNLQQVLDHLLEIESLAREVYRHLEEKATNSEVRELFSKLSKRCEERIKSLETLYSAVLEKTQGEEPGV
ncbi:MAG: hypothetical protein PWQ79_1386 [Thermococcaceae archaeon]|nr:hypothetical protein [Thermococcaceae archaeon]MDK2914471.1 hypothetical protein [Thermococcaceae archaeon]